MNIDLYQFNVDFDKYKKLVAESKLNESSNQSKSRHLSSEIYTSISRIADVRKPEPKATSTSTSTTTSAPTPDVSIKENDQKVRMDRASQGDMWSAIPVAPLRMIENWSERKLGSHPKLFFQHNSIDEALTWADWGSMMF